RELQEGGLGGQGPRRMLRRDRLGRRLRGEGLRLRPGEVPAQEQGQAVRLLQERDASPHARQEGQEGDEERGRGLGEAGRLAGRSELRSGRGADEPLSRRTPKNETPPAARPEGSLVRAGRRAQPFSSARLRSDGLRTFLRRRMLVGVTSRSSSSSMNSSACSRLRIFGG